MADFFCCTLCILAMSLFFQCFMVDAYAAWVAVLGCCSMVLGFREGMAPLKSSSQPMESLRYRFVPIPCWLAS